jgi:hypothetical protein
MFIVLRKKIVKRNLIIAICLMFLGRFLVASTPAQAATVDEVITITAEEMRAEGFNEQELKSMGFINGMGKVIVYNAKQKQIWEARVLKAKERIATAKYQGRKPNPKDLALVELDDQRKNPPKKPFVEKWFGKSTVQFIDYFKSGKNPPDAKIVWGESLTFAGLLMLLKALAPLAL